jgi:hypothetical protein
LPSVSDVETLINNSRALRLKLVELAAVEPLVEPAKEGVEALSKVGMQLERIIEPCGEHQARWETAQGTKTNQ